ncbi:MAG: transcriptional repressor [Chloroflexi bacterium]|nr:transcriptional repressor [Chloroflexota bacterium]
MPQPQIITESNARQKTLQWLESLQSNGYRLTSSRRAVVEVLATADQSLTAADLYRIGLERHKRLGLVSVYRTLEKLEELGLVQRVHRPDGCHAYISALEGHQHLLLCESCGRVEIFRGDNLKEFSRRLEGASGFEIHEHWLQFFGLCSQCH